MAEKITQAEIDRSYQLLGLLRCCRAAAENVEEQTKGEPMHVANGIGLALDVAMDIAGQLHDKLEFAMADATEQEIA